MSLLLKRSIYEHILYLGRHFCFQGDAFRFIRCAQNSDWKASYKFPAPPIFSFSISAVRSRAYSTNWKNERRSKSLAQCEFSRPNTIPTAGLDWKGRPIVPRDCGGRLSRIKGIKGGWRRLPGEWRRISDHFSTLPFILASVLSPSLSNLIFDWSYASCMCARI